MLDPKPALTVLARIASRKPRFLEQFLAGHLEQFIVPALEVAQESESHGPMGRILAKLIRETPLPHLCFQLDSLMPNSTVVLSEVAVEIARQCVERSKDDSPAKAQYLYRFSACLFHDHDLKASFRACKQSLRLYE